MFSEDINKILTDSIVESMVKSGESLIQKQLESIEKELRVTLEKEAAAFVKESFQCYRTGDHVNIKMYLPEIGEDNEN